MNHKDVTPQKVKDQLEKYFSKYLKINDSDARQLLGNAELQDKAYELVSLIGMMRALKRKYPLIIFSLSKGTSVVFRGKGGPIDRNKWPFINVIHNSCIVGEIWVDIEFMSISAGNPAKVKGHLYAKCHELDVLLIEPNVSGRPYPHNIYLAIEAKHRPYTKQLLKELLGVRREMAMRSSPVINRFSWWVDTVPSNPPSALISFCSYESIKNYSASADYWGIEMKHLPICPLT